MEEDSNNKENKEILASIIADATEEPVVKETQLN